MPMYQNEKPEGEHLIYLVQTLDCGVVHNSQNRKECIAMADTLHAKHERHYIVTGTRLYSGDPAETIYDTRKPKES